MLRIANVVNDASRRLADPLVQLDLVLASSVIVYHKMVSGRDELEKLLASLSSKVGERNCLYAVVEAKANEARLIICNGVVVAVVFTDKASRRSIVGTDAYMKLLELVSSEKCVVDVRVLPRDKLPQELQSLVARAREASVSLGQPPAVWIGLTLYGFKIERVIGEGGISYVLEGVNSTGRFALKVLREKSRFGSPLAVGNRGALESFARMASSMLKMTFASRSVIESALEERGIRVTKDKVKVLTGFSENIVQVYGVHIPRLEYRTLEEYVRSPPLVIMELVEGTTLDKVEHTISPFEARKVIYEVAGALALAHTLGFGHFDVKPQNVMVVRVGGFMRAKLFDFTALPVNRSRPPTLEEITPEYTDPYSLLHGARAYPSYDVYSLGLVAYRLLYKRKPYARLALNYVVLKRVVPKLAEAMGRSLPPEAQDHVRRFERLMATYPNPDDFLRRAEEVLESVEPLTPPPNQPSNIVDILRRMLALDIRRRYPDAVALLHDLGPLFGVTL